MEHGTATRNGTVAVERVIDAPRTLVYDAWTQLEHRREWFVGRNWTETARNVDLSIGGRELAHGRFPDGTETIYTSRFHLIEPGVRLIYSFDMNVAGAHFSVSLACVDFVDIPNASGGPANAPSTKLTYTEHGFFLVGDYDENGRLEGTNGLLDRFSAYVATIVECP